MNLENGLHVQMASSLTGPSYLELLFMPIDESATQPAPYKCDHLYVPSTPSFATKLTSGIEAAVEEFKNMHLAEVVANANGLLMDMKGAITDLKLKTVGERLPATMDEAKAAVAELRKIFENPDIPKALNDVAGAAAAARQLAESPDIKRFIADLPAISAELKNTAERIDKIVASPALQKTLDGTANVGPAVAELRRTLRELSNLISSQQGNIDALLTNLRRTSANVDAITADAKSNPARLMFGDPPPKAKP